MHQLLILTLWVSSLAHAEKASVKVKDIDTQEDTAIVIQKGIKPLECTEYQIIDGNEEVFAGAEFDKGKAYSLWKEACKEWKAELKDLNKENRIITMSCGSPKMISEGESKYSYKSAAVYKIRVRTKEKGDK